ncbi:MAG: hypothetical protein ACREDJ_00485, partial [Methylocella sp.]
FKFGPPPAPGASGRTGDGGWQDRAGRKARGARRDNYDTPPAGQALASGLVTRAKGPRLIGKRELDQRGPRRGGKFAAAFFLMRRAAWRKWLPRS